MRTSITLALILLGLSAQAHAQFGNLLGGKKNDEKKSEKASEKEDVVDVGDVLKKGGSLIQFVTLATDQGIKSFQTLVSVFPPEKVTKLGEYCQKYDGLTKKRKDNNIDADQLQIMTDAGEEAAKLEADWNSYDKAKVKAVDNANMRLNLMLLADAQAVLKLPGTAAQLQAALGKVSSNPLELRNANQIKYQVGIVAAITKHIQVQIKSSNVVKGYIGKIADKEKIKLTAVKPEQVSDTETMKKTVGGIPDAG